MTSLNRFFLNAVHPDSIGGRVLGVATFLAAVSFALAVV